MRWLLRSKIHKARVTKVDVGYVGSIGIDSGLMKKAGLLPGERVLVVSNTSGNRLETYVIPEKEGSGTIALYGAAGRLIKKGEEIIIMGFELSDGRKPIKPKIVYVDKRNRFLRYL
ncbi:MAG: aspartate 1-decarboxylase [Candidatus Pacearchaeota archaeon]